MFGFIEVILNHKNYLKNRNMPKSLFVFYCSKCDYENTVSEGDGLYIYLMDDETILTAPTSYGWCMKCNGVSKIHLGLSSQNLRNEIKKLNSQLDDVKEINILNLTPKSNYELKQINKILEAIVLKQNYLRVLNGKDSLHLCLSCGSKEVFPMQFAQGNILFPFNTNFTHIHCGGQIKMKHAKTDGVCSVYTEEVLKPVFAEETNTTV